jgi:predicted metal-binding protein
LGRGTGYFVYVIKKKRRRTLFNYWRNKKKKRLLLSLLEKKAAEANLAVIVVSPKEITVHEGVRLKCLVPQCEYYGVCRLCPPNLPPVSEIRAALSYFQQAYLVVLRYPPVAREEVWKPEKILLDTVNELEKVAWSKGFYRAAGLVVGGCKLCERCAPLHEPCRHPYRARPSPAGLGIDITMLAKRKGIPLSWPPGDELIFLGLLLV